MITWVGEMTLFFLGLWAFLALFWLGERWTQRWRAWRAKRSRRD